MADGHAAPDANAWRRYGHDDEHADGNADGHADGHAYRNSNLRAYRAHPDLAFRPILGDMGDHPGLWWIRGGRVSSVSFSNGERSVEGTSLW
jgi:hypothetical protein